MHILSYLSTHSLLAFGATSRKNHEFHRMSLDILRLAVFPRKSHALVAIIEPSAHCSAKFDNYVSVITRNRFRDGEKFSARRWNRNPSLSLAQTVADQNIVLADILSRYGPALRDLEYLAWDLTAIAATALAQSCSGLRKLALCFHHPNVRDRSVPRTYFDSPGPGSTMWNALAGIGLAESLALKLRTLQCLTIERSGITEWQLQKFVEANPGLLELRLKKCAGVGSDFLSWLGESKQGLERLEVLWLQNCHGVSSQGSPGLSWVDGMRSLKVQS